jgi:hypothetical protein
MSCICIGGSSFISYLRLPRNAEAVASRRSHRQDSGTHLEPRAEIADHNLEMLSKVGGRSSLDHAEFLLLGPIEYGSVRPYIQVRTMVQVLSS